MDPLEIVKMVAAAIGAGLGGWVSAHRSGRHMSASLARIEARLDEADQRNEERFDAVERRLGAVERVRVIPVQTPALRPQR